VTSSWDPEGGDRKEQEIFKIDEGWIEKTAGKTFVRSIGLKERQETNTKRGPYATGGGG